jgi:hypothetical protein
MDAERVDQPGAAPPDNTQVGVAVGLKSLHVKSALREECSWCFKRWPCSDWAWAERTIRAAAEARRTR